MRQQQKVEQAGDATLSARPPASAGKRHGIAAFELAYRLSKKGDGMPL